MPAPLVVAVIRSDKFINHKKLKMKKLAYLTLGVACFLIMSCQNQSSEKTEISPEEQTVVQQIDSVHTDMVESADKLKDEAKEVEESVDDLLKDI